MLLGLLRLRKGAAIKVRIRRLHPGFVPDHCGAQSCPVGERRSMNDFPVRLRVTHARHLRPEAAGCRSFCRR